MLKSNNQSSLSQSWSLTQFLRANTFIFFLIERHFVPLGNVCRSLHQMVGQTKLDEMKVILGGSRLVVCALSDKMQRGHSNKSGPNSFAARHYVYSH